MKYPFFLMMAFMVNIASAQQVDSFSIKQVDSLIQDARRLFKDRDYEKALEINNTAEQIALKKLGRESLSYSNTCFNRGRIYELKGDYEEAEKGYLESKSIIESVLGNEHLDYAWSLNNLAAMYNEMGKNEKAEPLYLEAKAIREKVLGKEHPEYAVILSNLATMYVGMGKYEKAEPLYLESKSIKEKALGREHPEYAPTLMSLAIFYGRMGNYEKAEPLFLEAIAIEEKKSGKEDIGYAKSLGNLAILYKIMGDYEKAELLYFESKNIFEKLLGIEHPDYAKSLGNLAVLYRLMGNYEKAELLYTEEIAIVEKVFGKENPNYITSLSNLALLYSIMGNYEKAEPLLLETKTIGEKIFGNEHPTFANSLHSLASMYMNMGNHQKAEPLYIESIALREKIFGKEHKEYAHAIHNLAIMYKTMGNYEKAEPLYIESIAIYNDALGKEHPDYALSIKNLAELYETQFQYTTSEPLMDEYFMLTKTRLVHATSFLSEQELAKLVITYRSMGDQLSSFLLGRQSNIGQQGILPDLVFDHSLFQKGFLLNAASHLHLSETTSPESAEINLRLIGFRRLLAAEYAKPITKRKGIAELEEKANLAEKELARTVSGYAEALKQVKWQEVQAALSETAMAMEFVHFRVNFPNSSDSVMYAALLIRPGTAQPLFIPLFEEQEFDHLLSGEKERKADYVNDLYIRADRGIVKLGSEKKSLYDLIWAKIEATGLEGIETVYYSPSGVLHRLNLGAIAIDEETILSDRYNLVALNSTRQLVIPSTVTTRANDALLVGGVNFEEDTLLATPEAEPLLVSRSTADAWTESGTRGGKWSYLKWTEKEVTNITTTLAEGGFKSTQLTGSEATEEAIKTIGTASPSPRVLHLATHGFFFPDPQAQNEGLGLGQAEPVFKSSDNPMIRSGLILAGGNYAWQRGKAVSPDKEDGILTAYEISQMNLANTELVVLSACETGLGDIQGNEGVYGLQRAFKIAGAKYLIMSLWQVPDRETMEFMTVLYKNWLEENRSIPDAFRKTQREMRDRFYNPYSWAGFVLVE